MNRKSILKFIKNYWTALRPFSLTLAAAAVGYGILAAFIDGHLFSGRAWHDWLVIGLVIIAGLASQAGANLINDFFEGSFKYPDPGMLVRKFLGRERNVFDIFVFLSGIAVLGIAALTGLYLVFISDIWMLVIGLTGLVGSYAYTGEPFVYKRKGLGVPLSFLLMGPLMSLGAYYPFASSFSWMPVIISLPGSLLVPALMISNEMRDFSRDHRLSLGTLSVRIGSMWSTRLYESLLVLMYVLTVVYIIAGIFPWYAVFSTASLPLAVSAWNHVRNFKRLSIPATNRLHLVYNSAVIVSIAAALFSGYYR